MYDCGHFILQELPNRAAHRYLCFIVHLQEVQVTTSTETYKYSLLEEVMHVYTLYLTEGSVHTHNTCAVQQLQLMYTNLSFILLDFPDNRITRWRNSSVEEYSLLVQKVVGSNTGHAKVQSAAKFPVSSQDIYMSYYLKSNSYLGYSNNPPCQLRGKSENTRCTNTSDALD